MYACAATPDAKYIVAGGEDSALRVWTLADGKAVATFEAPKPSAETEEENELNKFNRHPAGFFVPICQPNMDQIVL